MSEPKTTPTDASVEAFLEAAPESRRDDARAVVRLMSELTGEAPVMWGPSIVGFGRYVYTYASGRSGEWPIAAFSPRKANLVLYLMPGFEEATDLLARLGKHKVGKSCLYLNRLADLDPEVLRELVSRSVTAVRARYPSP
jgi:Domain of unknown function (DU1801)